MILQSVITEDGSSTLFVPELNEHYHSIHGAIQESMHIFIGAGFKQLKTFPACILEVGFGTGLNAFLTLLESGKEEKQVQYSSIEKYPVDESIVVKLNYPHQVDPSKTDIFKALHTAIWDDKVRITEHFTLHKIKSDLTDTQLPDSYYDLIYFDAFGPDVQPALWTEEIFRMLNEAMKQGAWLVTYSVKGSVKRALKAAGFRIEKLPGPVGKREILRAFK